MDKETPITFFFALTWLLEIDESLFINPKKFTIRKNMKPIISFPEHS